MTHDQEIAYMQSEEHLWERTLQDVGSGAEYLRKACRHRLLSEQEKKWILRARDNLAGAAHFAEFQPIEFQVLECGTWPGEPGQGGARQGMARK